MDWGKQRTRRKEKYEELKNKSICTRCRKEKATPGFATCKTCREKERLRWQSRRNGRIKRNGRTKRNGYHKLTFNNKTTDTLNGICEEVVKYNEAHGANYSYGYYSALKFRGLI